jgi:iron complex transport system permease protein
MMNTLANKRSLAFHFEWNTALVLCLLVTLLAITLIGAMSFGATSIPVLNFINGDLNDNERSLLLLIRLPRVLLAALVGASLAVSGAAMQGLFRNPLADPGLIGISSGAALSVAAMIVLIGPVSGMLGLYGISIAAFIGGLTTALLIFKFAHLKGIFSVTYMLLAGIAINALAGAGTGLLTYISNDEQLRTLTFWTMGSLGGALWPSVIVVLTIIVPSTILLVRYAKQLNILLLGEQEARYLGVNTQHLKFVIIMTTALSVGAAVAVSGIIGFVGLVIPHLIRLTIGPNHRVLIPASALLGAILLVIADTVSRTVVSPAEMPVGIITSLIGGPFFLWLLLNQNTLRSHA